MADISPFAALRYDPDRVDLSAVIAPPYDVVDPRQHDRLEAASPYNAVHLEISREEPERDRYEAARCRLEEWLGSGVLRVDEHPRLYVYRMGFRDSAGNARQTTGVLGALQLDASAGGQVMPHERTMGKPLGDRLQLLRACRANISPIWALSLASGLSAACEPTGPPLARATDGDGVHHRLWAIGAPAAIEAISMVVAQAPVVIADGHHRYETALAYQQERRSANGDQPGDHDRVLAFVVELAENELDVRAIHRLVSGLPDPGMLPTELSEHFNVEATNPAAPWPQSSPPSAPELVMPGARYRLTPRPGGLPSRDMADTELVEEALAKLAPHTVSHHHSPTEVMARVESGEAQAGFLLRPVTVARLTAAAHAGVRLPEKTTFFYPKPVTGLVFRQLET